MATTLAFPAHAPHRIPPKVDPLDAALVEPLAVAYRGLQRLTPEDGEPITIVGCAGSIGLLCAMTARALGTGTASESPTRQLSSRDIRTHWQPRRRTRDGHRRSGDLGGHGRTRTHHAVPVDLQGRCSSCPRWYRALEQILARQKTEARLIGLFISG
jgi:hypothetical protein